MAAELDGIVVKITGDASCLESTIKGVESELSALEKAQGKSNTATATGTKGLSEYKKQMQETQNTLNTSRAVLNNTKKAYEDNQKSYYKNISTLRQQQTSLEGLITTKNNEIKALEHANTTVNKGSIAYNDNVKAIEWTKTELSSLEQQHKRVTGSIRTQETVLAGSKKAYEDAQATVKLATKQYEDYEKGLKAVERAEQSQQLQETGKKWKDTSDTINSVTKPLQYTALALAAGGVAAGKFAIDFEDSFAAVKKTVDGTPEQLDEIKQKIIDMTTTGINGHKAIPQTTAELNELAASAGQLGFAADEVANFTEVMAMIETSTNLQGEAGAQTLARYMNVTQTAHDRTENLGSAIVYLGNNYETTEAEIASFGLRLGRTGTLVHMNAADVLGYSTALSSMGINAEAGGSAVSKSWTKIDNAVSKGGQKLNAFAKVAGKSSKEFAEQWKSDAAGAFNDFLKGLNEAENLPLLLQDLGITELREADALKALAIGYDKAVAAVKDANKAWEENTALQDEFNQKAETTASQIQIVKNNMVEAARGIGETMLPTIKDVSTDLAGFAQKLSGMSDENKKTLVNVAGGIIVLGAASKGLASGTKFIGNFVESIGKIKEAASAGGILSKFAPMLSSITTVAGPAALAVAGIGAAALTAKAGYDAWYDSNYRFAKGLDEQTEKLISQREQWKSLNDLRWEYNDLTGKINSNSLEGVQLESAKARLDEIKKILKEQYKIDVDSEDIDKALKKAEQLAEISKTRSETQLKNQIDDLAPNYEKAVQNLPKLRKQYDEAEASAQKYRNTQEQIENIRQSFSYGEISEAEYLSQVSDAMKAAGVSFDEHLGRLPDKTMAAVLATNLLDSAINGLGVNDLNKKIEDYEKNVDAYTQAVEGLADVNLDNFTDALKAGADGTKYLDRIAEYTKAGILDADEYAKKVSLITSEQESLDKVFETGGDTLDKYISDYLNNMMRFGASAEQTQAGLQSLADKFTELGHSLGTLPKDQRIEITADGKINFVANYDDLESAPNQDGTVDYNADYTNIKDPPTLHGTVNYTPVISGVGENSNARKFSMSTFHWAKGTQDAPGGLSVVNDEKGIPDPRELIKHGSAYYMFEGRDVPVMLSPHDKVFTASQTKRMLDGIPHYATGKNNSDAFTAARDDWTHYTRTHAVTTAEELQKWVEFSQKFKDNQKDIWDIQEQIFSLQQKVTAELNKQSLAYIDDRAALNDWEDFGDSAIDAFGRIRDRNKEALDAGRITWEQYSDNVSEAGKTIYDGQLAYSKSWLEHEKKYNGLSADNYIAGIDRMMDYTRDYYEKGLIDKRKFVEESIKLDEERFDSELKYLDIRNAESTEYLQRRAYFNNFEENGDDIKSAWERAIAPLNEELAKRGEAFWDEYVERKTQIGEAFADEYWGMQDRWSDEQRKYFGMSDEEYAETIERRIEKANEFYELGIIGERKLHERTTEMNHAMWDEAENAYEEMLRRQSDYISEMRDKFQKQEQALRDSWTIEDRAADMATVGEQLRVYAGAVTDRGQQKYKELQAQMKKLQRDEELYNLQTRNNAVIEQYEAEYKQLEADKKKMIAQIARANENISDIVGTFNSNLEGMASSVTSLLSQILNAVNSAEFVGPSTNYNDNRVISITEAAAMLERHEIMSLIGR